MLTACIKDCPDCCSIIIKKELNKIKIIGNHDHPITKGFTCAKIKKHINRLKSPSRITSPMLRSKNGFKKISWNQALDICFKRINPILKDDPEKILHVQGHGARGITKELVDNFFTFLGCTKTCGSLCDITGIQACIDDFGALDHNNIKDVLNSSHIINFGKDFSSSSIHLTQIMHNAREKGIHITSIWPGGNNYKNHADKLIRITPGTDRFLVIAIVKHLMKDEQINQSYLKKCAGKNKYFKIINKYSIEFLSRQCGVSKKDIRYLANIYSKNKISTIIGWGIQRHLNGMETVRHINALSWLSGNIGYQGAGVYMSISSLKNLDLSWTQFKPKRSILLPVLADEIEKCTPKIKAAFINCSNVVNQAPDSKHLFKVFRDIDFTIVIDAFFTDTAAAADLILPCTLMLEDNELAGSYMHEYLQYSRKAFDPPDQCKSDFEIAKKFNEIFNTKFVFPDPEECFRLSFPKSDTDLSFDEFKAKGFAFAGKNKIVFNKTTSHQNKLFSLVQTLSKEPDKNPDFPMHLLSLINKNFMHSQILPEDQQSIPVVRVNPDSKNLKKINPDKKTFLVTDLGKLEIKIKFDKSLHPDAIIYRRGDWMMYKGGINTLIEARLTDSGNGAAYYAQKARLENL